MKMLIRPRALREHRDVVGRDRGVLGRFFAAAVIGEAAIKDRHRIRPGGEERIISGEAGGILAEPAAASLAHAHQPDDLRQIDMQG